MALVVEDGTGLPDADSYVSVASADAYHVARGNAAWAAAEEGAKEVALRNATAYIDSNPEYPFAGAPLAAGQALEWPRTGFGWPLKRVTDATSELALRALTGPLFADVVAEGRIKSETIGPLKTDYADPVNGGQTRYAFVDGLLAPLLVKKGGWGVTPLARA
jgi:hypothetical protein